MKTTTATAVLLISALLAACNADNTAQTVDSIKADVAKDIETDMNKAIDEAKADLTDINVTLADGGKAKITAAGDLSIDGEPVTLSAEQREQMGKLMRERKGDPREITQKYLDKLPKADQDALKQELETARLEHDKAIRAILTPEQQKRFDAQTSRMMGSMKGHGDHAAGGHHGHHGSKHR